MDSATGDGLNRAQRTAVTTEAGPLLVLAGAGTGKTRVITFRIAELIRSGTAPSRILAVTFTNKAAKEMRARAATLLGRKKRRSRGPEISTFHSLCVRILRRHARLLGYPENFSIYDRGDQESVARGALRDIRVGAQKLSPGDLIQMISSFKSRGLDGDQAEQHSSSDRELLGALAYQKYQTTLRTSGAMDFDDLLSNTERLFSAFPEARFAEASRFDHVLIDEYQDTNALQYRIVHALVERHRNLCVVGDDDQSIYGFRGAEVAHILGFTDQFPEARVVRLEENYRCSGWIIHLANQLIGHNQQRHEKTLRAAKSNGNPPRFLPFQDENHESETVVHEIFQKINRSDEERIVASDIAILFRTNEQPRTIEQELRRAGVPYRLVGGQSFFDRKEIKDLLCYLRVLQSPIDEVSLLRVINKPPRGIGNASVQVLVDEAVRAGKPLWELLPAALSHPDVPQVAAEAIEGFRHLVEEFRAKLGRQPLSDLVVELIERTNYKAEIERLHKDPSDQEARWGAVMDLVNSAKSYEDREEDPTLSGFLDESTLTDRDSDKEDGRSEHAVTLMTLHSAKGLEFRVVYLVGMEEGLLPHKRTLTDENSSIAEERRLAYVGLTRAKDELSLSFCKSRMKWGKPRPQIPSRFLMEMRGETAKAQAIAQQAEQAFARESAMIEGPRASRTKGKSSEKKKSASPKKANLTDGREEKVERPAAAKSQPAGAAKSQPAGAARSQPAGAAKSQPAGAAKKVPTTTPQPPAREDASRGYQQVGLFGEEAD